MGSIQILKLTKELKEKGIDVSNKDVIEFLNGKGVKVTNHMNKISDEEASMVRDKFDAAAGEKKSAPVKEEEKPAEVKKEKAAEKAPVKAKPPVKAVPPKKKHIIFATNNRNSVSGNSRSNAGRQVYRISGGKIEDPEKTVKKTFKHTEVASPDAFEGIKLPPKEKEDDVKILETREETVTREETPKAPEKTEQSPKPAPAPGPRKIYGNVYDRMRAGANTAPGVRRGVNNGIQEGNKSG